MANGNTDIDGYGKNLENGSEYYLLESCPTIAIILLWSQNHTFEQNNFVFWCHALWYASVCTCARGFFSLRSFRRLCQGTHVFHQCEVGSKRNFFCTGWQLLSSSWINYATVEEDCCRNKTRKCLLNNFNRDLYDMDPNFERGNCSWFLCYLEDSEHGLYARLHFLQCSSCNFTLASVNIGADQDAECSTLFSLEQLL